MRYGFYLPTRGPTATRNGILALAREGERLGLHSAMVADHIVFPVESESVYPYTLDGKHPSVGDALETFSILGLVAGATERLRLVTSVLVLPYRNPVLTAKMAASLDVLSGGRLTLGVGAGWLAEEFAALGTPPFAERGAVADEYLAAFRALWTMEKPRFDGRYVRFADVVFAPKPAQQPHPPLWVGGESGPALRRAARLGNGWYPIGSNPSHPLDTLTRYRAAVERLRALAREAGRDPAEIALAYRCARHGGAAEEAAGSGERRLFSGGAAEIVGDLRAFRDLGVASVDFALGGATPEASLERMKRFRDEVMARV